MDFRGTPPHPYAGTSITPTTLRQAIRADISAIEAVRHAVTENTLRPGLISPEDIRREIEETGRGWVIETPGDDVIAFAIGNARTGNIWALFVAPGFEGRGHGSRLHAAMVDWLWSQALDLLWLDTGRATRARAFYEKRGWRPVGAAPHDQVRYELRRSDEPLAFDDPQAGNV